MKTPKGMQKYVVMEAQIAKRVEYHKHEFFAKPGLSEKEALAFVNNPDNNVTTTSYGEPDDSVLTGEMEQVLVTPTKSEDEAIEEAANVLSSIGFR